MYLQQDRAGIGILQKLTRGLSHPALFAAFLSSSPYLFSRHPCYFVQLW